MSQENVAVVGQVFDAFNRRDCHPPGARLCD